MDGLDMDKVKSLQSKDQQDLLDTVDELRNYGVHQFISLPQIIVCGDQSSGKSSVLEAISGVQFPVNDGLCTRFTTEVILRRDPHSLATVKLIPSDDASPLHREELLKFNKPSVSHAEIPDLISEAKSIMGLTGGSTFSRDILQLEVSGPELPHLTLVDLPGLIHHPNKDQTDEDVRIPKDLVLKYMKEPRTIVLAIVTAKNDTSNQVVLKMAKQVDPEGVRTMGIITKPDLLIRNSPNESTFFSLASNRETKFKLDWHVLRNGDYDNRKNPDFDRDEAEEKFFSSGIWVSLPSHKRGVKALRKRLSEVLYQQIQTELPGLLTEIENELNECKKISARLGEARDTPHSQRQYLGHVAQEFYNLVREGNRGTYQHEFFLDSSNSKEENDDDELSTRLRAAVRQEEQQFLYKMKLYGHTKQIGNAWMESIPGVTIDPPEYTTEKKFLEETRRDLNKSKGKELPGTFSPMLVDELFKKQSWKWKIIASEFAENVWEVASRFLDEVLDHIVTDEDVRLALQEEVIDSAMEERRTNLRNKVEEVYSPYSRNNPATLNPRFVQELEKRRHAYHQTQQIQQTQQSAGFGSSPNNDAEDADTIACRELLYLMETYYAIALDVFVDNIASLAVENCLMFELENMLSAVTVASMDEEKLETIASESEDIREERNNIRKKQQSLQDSLKLCKRHFKKHMSSRASEPTKKDKNSTPYKTSTTQQFKKADPTTTKTAKQSSSNHFTGASSFGTSPAFGGVSSSSGNGSPFGQPNTFNPFGTPSETPRPPLNSLFDQPAKSSRDQVPQAYRPEGEQ